MKKKFRMSQSNINLLLAIGGIAIFVAVFFLVYQKFTVKNEELTNTLNTKTAYLSELREYNANIETYRTGVEEHKTNINKNLARLPIDYKNEDILLSVKKMHDNMKLNFTSFPFSSNEVVETFTTVIDDKQTEVTGYKVSTGLSLVMNYKKFKDYVETIYNPEAEINYIDNISLSYDSSNAKLNVNVQLSKFFINYEGAAYEGMPSPEVVYGNEDPFNSAKDEARIKKEKAAAEKAAKEAAKAEKTTKTAA